MIFRYISFCLIILSFGLCSCSTEDGGGLSGSRTLKVSLLMEYPEIPQLLREKAKEKTVDILSQRLDRIEAEYDIVVTRDGLDITVTTERSDKELEFLLSTKGSIEMWAAIPGDLAAQQIQEGENRLSFLVYPDEYDFISGIEYTPDSVANDLDSNYVSVLDTIDITRGLENIQKTSLIYMAYPFTSRIRFGKPGVRAKVGRVRSTYRRDVEILFDKAFEYGLIHRDIAFYWGLQLKNGEYYDLFAVDTSTEANLGLRRSMLKGVEYLGDGLITLKLNEAGEVGLLNYSEVHLDRPMAILLDEKIIATPIMSRMINKGRFTVDVNLSKDSTKLLAHILDLPVLPLNITVLDLRED